MPALDAYARARLEALERERLLRRPVTTVRQTGTKVVRDGRTLISFSCNDYLGLTHHPKVIEAAKRGLEEQGAGAGASRLVTGNSPNYEVLETRLARFKGTEAACVFGSGYLANLGIIQALVSRRDAVIADKLVHACLLDGARLSGARVFRFSHNDLNVLENILIKNKNKYEKTLILVDGVYSMDGDLAPLPELVSLARAYDAWLLSDDAHGLGVLGRGRGSSYAFDPPAKPDLQMGTLSKALGTYGGYVCASNPVINYLKSAARSLIYSTALPPSVLASALAALDIIEAEPDRVARPVKLARQFTTLLGLPEARSPIVPLILGDAETALAASRELEEEGFLVSAIRPPTVPPNTARLRFTFSAEHEENDIERLASLIRAKGWGNA